MKRKCRRCNRYLASHLHQAGGLCRACNNINPNHFHRFAIGHIIQEEVCTGEADDLDLSRFVQRHSQNIVSTDRDTVKKHL